MASSLSFLTAQQEVAGQLGLDIADTNTATRIKRWINLGYKDTAGFHDWSWLKAREVVPMVIDVTTGTVSVATGGTTVTFSSAPATSKTGFFIQFSSADDWYKITAHTAGETTATIETAYVQTSSLVAGTYILRKYFYSLSSSVEYIEYCKQAITNEMVKMSEYREYTFPTETASNVSEILVWGNDSSNYWTFTPYPIPSAAHLLEFGYIKSVTELSGNTDTAIFPQRFDSILINRAKMYGYEFLNDDTMYKLKYSETEDALKKMRNKDKVDKGKMNVISAVDGGPESSGFIRFPSNYEAD